MKQIEAVDVSTAEFDAGLRKLENLLADHVQDRKRNSFHKLVRPGVGLVDRLRDELTGRATR